jgi:multicomponent Na+:H+ antiporter subunit B
MSAHRPIIVRVLGKTAIPIVFVFAIHVAMSAPADPGGGFAGGAFAAAALILYGLVFGLDEARRAVPTFVLRIGATGALLALILLGMAGMPAGLEFLSFQAFAQAGPRAVRLGAGLVEAGLTIVVFCSFSLVFYAIAGRVAEIRAEEW